MGNGKRNHALSMVHYFDGAQSRKIGVRLRRGGEAGFGEAVGEGLGGLALGVLAAAQELAAAAGANLLVGAEKEAPPGVGFRENGNLRKSIRRQAQTSSCR